MANNTEKSGGSVFLDTTSAQHALQKLNKEIDNYDRKLKQTNLTARETASLQKSKADTAAKAATIQNQIEKGLGSTYQQQKKYVSELRKELTGLPRGTKEYTDSLLKLKDASKVLTDMKREMSGISAAQKEAGKSSTFLGSFFGNLASNVVSKGISFVSSFIGGIKDEAFQAEEAVSGLANSLENAGRTDLFNTFLDAADELADRFKRLDNDDITGVFTKLIDYGKLTEAQIKQLTPVIIDYAAKQKISLADATDAITKALEGNAKGLKTYGVNLKDAATFAERYGLVVGELGRKVNGAEEAFEKTNRGALEVFTQKIRNAQESIGNFILKLLEAPKSADQLFDQAKKQVEDYDRSLEPLLARYDELKAKTILNKDEQTELNGIINRIVQIVPTAATEFDKYGRALDINKEKVKEFRKENAAFVQARERDAIKELTGDATDLAKAIELLGENKTRVSKSGLGTEAMKEALETLTTNIAKLQTDLIAQTDVLINKYQVELPKAVKAARDAALKDSGEDQKAAGIGKPDANKVVGNGKTPEEEEAEKRAKEEAKKRAKELAAERKRQQEKVIEDQNKLAEEIRKIQDELTLAFESDQIKEIAAAIEKYRKLRELAHGNFDFITDLAALQLEELRSIDDKYNKEKQKKRDEDDKKVQEAFKTAVDKAAKQAQDQVKVLQNTTNDKAVRDRLAGLELNILNASGRKRLEAEKELLKQQMDLELANEDLTEQEKALIREKYRQQEWELEINFQAQRVETIMYYLQQAAEIFEQFSSAQQSKDEKDLARLQQRNERERSAYKKQLNNRLISQQEYNKKIAQLENEEERRKEAQDKKRFDREKKLQIAQAIVNGFMGITSVLAARPGATDILSLGLFRAINIAFTVASTAAQIAAISKTKYGKGGYLKGPSHSEKGMPVINPRTGEKEAEVEGGEVILSKNTVRNNQQIVGALLNSSLRKNGASIQPFWKNVPYKSIDTVGITRSVKKVRHYENGGTFESPGTQGSEQAQTVVVPSMSEEQQVLLQALLQRLNAPIRAHVVLRDINEKQGQLDGIKNDAIFK